MAHDLQEMINDASKELKRNFPQHALEEGRNKGRVDCMELVAKKLKEGWL